MSNEADHNVRERVFSSISRMNLPADGKKLGKDVT